ncbi:cupin [Polynucleobacter necessarius]|uniref:cupin n=1 Tax=Polynucleobacter necessarius TaxID=576610 RepID=UPI000E09D306|nr:cupin [Polynucleobacter necessarius]
MNQPRFLQALQESGFPHPVEVQQPPNGQLPNHTHAFAVQALILEGYIEIEINGIKTRYNESDVFQLALEELHAERYGLDGVKYLASRKMT